MILILGNGFVGAALSERLTEMNLDVKVFSSKAGSVKEVDYREGDFRSIENHKDFFEDISFVVQTIHTSVPYSSMLDVVQDAKDNIISNIKLLEVLKEKSIKNSIFISSGGAIYGDQHVGYIDETSFPKPISAYGVAKLSIEHYINLYNKHYGLNTAIIRPSNLYGLGQDIRKKQGVITHLIASIRDKTKFQLWGDGNGKKDYIHIDDFVNALVKVISSPPQGGKLYNISGGHEHSVNELIQKIENAYGGKIEMEMLSVQPFDVMNVSLNSNEFRKDYNWSPKYSIDEGIENVIESLRKCPS